MGVVLGLGVGVGRLLVYWSLVSPGAPRRERRPSWLEALLKRAGLEETSAAGVTVLCLSAGLGVAMIVQVSLAFALLAGYLPIAVLNGRARRRQRDLAEVWPEAVDNLASAVRAGMSLPEALAQLAVRGPEPLRPAFSAFALDYQVTGRFAESLDRLKDRLADPVGDRVVEGLRIAREVGGGELGRLLERCPATCGRTLGRGRSWSPASRGR